MSTISAYTGDGSTAQFDITFSYRNSSTVKASIDGVETTAFTFVNPSRIEFSAAPANGAEIKIFRRTPITPPEVEFEDGAIIRGDDLNDAIAQARDRVEELDSDVTAISDAAIRLPVGETTDALPAADERANTLLGFDDAGVPAVTDRGNGGAATDLTLLVTAPGSTEGPRSLRDLKAASVKVLDWIPAAHRAAILSYTIGAVDLAGYINAAAAYASSNNRELSFDDGLYPHASTLAFGNGGAKVRGTGNTRTKYIGAGGAAVAAVSFDLGSSPSDSDIIFEGFIVDGGGTAGIGVYLRGAVAIDFARITVRNVTHKSLYVLGDVAGTFVNFTTSGNDPQQTVDPINGIVIDGTGAVSSSTSLVFINPKVEVTTGDGIVLVNCDNTEFIAGTSEGCGGLGVKVGATCTRNKFELMFLEQNAGGDIEIAGDRNEFNVTANSLAASSPYISVPSIHILAGANENVVKGRAVSAKVEALALDNDLELLKTTAESLTVPEVGITDSGTRTLTGRVRTFLPEFGDNSNFWVATWATRDARAWLRRGKQATLICELASATLATAPNGDEYVYSLPWQAAKRATCPIDIVTGFPMPAGCNRIIGVIEAGSSILNLYGVKPDHTLVRVQHPPGNASLAFTLNYEVA